MNSPAGCATRGGWRGGLGKPVAGAKPCGGAGEKPTATRGVATGLGAGAAAAGALSMAVVGRGRLTVRDDGGARDERAGGEDHQSTLDEQPAKPDTPAGER